MRRRHGLLVAGLAPVAMACTIHPAMVTTTEVITPSDSAPIFGDNPTVRILEEVISVSWDSSARQYVGPQNVLMQTRGLRAARLTGSVYLLQLEQANQYYLFPVRASDEQEVTPLLCPLSESDPHRPDIALKKSDDGRRITVSGSRTAILRFVQGLLDTCSPMFRVDAFTPLEPTLLDGDSEQ